MVACKTVSEYKRNQEKIRKFCLEEKAEQARQQEAKAIQSRSAPLHQAAIPQPSNIINTRPMGHEEVVAMATKNKRAHHQLKVPSPGSTPTIHTRKNIARKSKARKAPEPRGTLKPQWNIIQDGTITNYSHPHHNSRHYE